MPIYSSIREKFDKHPRTQFVAVLLILLSYAAFSMYSHGFKEGLLVSVLTWSFFVLCTPVADAGILIDFPIRLVTGIKMLHSEIMVWLVAIAINIFTFYINLAIYDKTILLSLFKHILESPWPYWSIILLSGVGTFLSIIFADGLIDRHSSDNASLLKKFRGVIFAFTIISIIVIYDFLLNKLGVNIPLI